MGGGPMNVTSAKTLLIKKKIPHSYAAQGIQTGLPLQVVSLGPRTLPEHVEICDLLQNNQFSKNLCFMLVYS